MLSYLENLRVPWRRAYLGVFTVAVTRKFIHRKIIYSVNLLLLDPSTFVYFSPKKSIGFSSFFTGHFFLIFFSFLLFSPYFLQIFISPFVILFPHFIFSLSFHHIFFQIISFFFCFFPLLSCFPKANCNPIFSLTFREVSTMFAAGNLFPMSKRAVEGKE